MDALQPHPPIDSISYIFAAFVRIYTTTFLPIDFVGTQTNEQVLNSFPAYSLQARRALYHLYSHFKTLIHINPLHIQLLENAYLFSIQAIHIKFGTSQQQNPFLIPTL